jgi:hypothetical protein
MKKSLRKESRIMLRSVKSIKDYTIGAKDDTIGKVDDLFSEEPFWSTRYIVVDTGSWT